MDGASLTDSGMEFQMTGDEWVTNCEIGMRHRREVEKLITGSQSVRRLVWRD